MNKLQHVKTSVPSVFLSSVDEHSNGDQKVAHLIPSMSGNISFMEIDHEIFSTVILSFPLIQEGQLSVSGERMCTCTG